ncbi:hypothetical protein [Pontibacter anaerobius]|uniref:Lipoprotein n=1 Tax=Pontibacter anaerobius TaxID=2993940 RepID=A0ABT3RGP6_9BACT|nr:hypothetical protein [Pontibacter anaerobius]MCX2740589.1 hypothetical protein [Pontibacter anaerobius]
MKQLIYSVTFLLSSTLILSCYQGEAKQEAIATESEEAIQANQSVTKAHSEVNREKLASECEAYYDEWEKLNAEKAGFFEKNILAKALANPELPEQNRKFLLDLKEYLHQSEIDKSGKLAPQQLLFPVFKLNESELGVIGFPQYDTKDETYTDISAEHKLLNSHNISTTADPHIETKLVYHKQLADSLFRHLDRSVYTFTDQQPVKTQLQNFGSYNGECLEYYHYQLNPQPYSTNDKVMFGSRYNLELRYKTQPDIDRLNKAQYKPQCADCPESIEATITFSSLKGVDGLYFTYADTFPLNNKLETPSRGLVMKMGDKIVYLWYAEVDLIGCSCI